MQQNRLTRVLGTLWTPFLGAWLLFVILQEQHEGGHTLMPHALIAAGAGLVLLVVCRAALHVLRAKDVQRN